MTKAGKQYKTADKPSISAVPILPLKDSILFPKTSKKLFIGREKSIISVKKAFETNGNLFITAQKDPQIINPRYKDLFKTGTVAKVTEFNQQLDGTYIAQFNGLYKAALISIKQNGTAEIKKLNDYLPDKNTEHLKILITEIEKSFSKTLGKKSGTVSKDIFNNKDPYSIINQICEYVKIDIKKQNEILNLDSIEDKLALISVLLNDNSLIKDSKRRAGERIKKKFENAQKDFLLNEQIKELKKELSDTTDEESDFDALKKKGEETMFSEEALTKFRKELKRLQSIPVFSPEAGIIKNYIDWMLDLPWEIMTEEESDLNSVQKTLHKNHYGLEDVKERILEFVAVQKLAGKNNKGSILCLTGPPGTGKTTLAISVAKALKRKFVRMSLGGMRDEAEIRGHRRTYVGAMPGKIIQGLKKADSVNPVFLLDEIDKMGQDFRGDPASALLEVLDPEINPTFMDHFLEVEFDLSNVFFITTANAVHRIPQALHDRMEIINIPGYTEDEKVKIAQKFVIPKQIKASGLEKLPLKFQTSIIRKIIHNYTREAGVRNLERAIQKICRKIAKKTLLNDIKAPYTVSEENLGSFLGNEKFRQTNKAVRPQIGLVKGLAWTEAGGEVLDVEVRCINGSGKVFFTGKMGDVMKESAQAALSFVRNLLQELNYDKFDFSKQDIHVHIPEGAIPKDGPSAGITIASGIISAVLKKPADISFAMTGELSLLGKVLPVGGLKEKILAAKRAGIKKLLLPEENRKNIEEFSNEVVRGIRILFISNMDDVLKQVLPNIFK